VIIKAWVTPRYLDKSWYKQFTVTLSKTKQGDVPVILSVHSDSYEGAKLDTDTPSYGDIIEENRILTAEVHKLKSMIDNGLGWEDIRTDI